MPTVPVRRAPPKGVKISGPSISLSGAIVNGVSSGCGRCDLFREVSVVFNGSMHLLLVFDDE